MCSEVMMCRRDLVCRKWLSMSENVAHRKIMNCNTSGNHLLKISFKWKIKLVRHSHSKRVPENRLRN